MLCEICCQAVLGHSPAERGKREANSRVPDAGFFLRMLVDFNQIRAAHRIAVLLFLATMYSPAAALPDVVEPPNRARIVAAEIGLKNYYKLGCWTPVAVEVDVGRDGHPLQDFRVEVTTCDSDGVLVTARTTVPAPAVGKTSRAVAYTQVGRINSSIHISLYSGEQVVDEMSLAPNATATQNRVQPIAATSELIVSLGTADFGLSDAFSDRSASGKQLGRQVIELADTSHLPMKWFGYDGVDVMLLPVGDGTLCQKLAADEVKKAALARWIELGGRLIILCDGNNAQAMLQTGSLLASLSPGKLVEVVRLTDKGAIEHYAASSETPGVALAADVPILVPRLTNVEGTIEAYAGRRSTDLPLVVRTARGFGEITYVGFELSSPPFANWAGRTPFLRTLLRPYLQESVSEESSQKLMTTGVNDLAGALRQQLGSSFSGLRVIGFPLVTTLALAYLAVLGPLDYLLTQRWLRKRQLAWITFPLILVMFSILALAVGKWSTGSTGAQINRIDLVDFDAIGGHVRGTSWATLFSPEAQLFDVTAKPAALTGMSYDGAELLFSWWGLPGVGIGGMQSRASDLGLVSTGYRFDESRTGLEKVPVLVSATKSFIARWNSTSRDRLDAQLIDEDGLATGKLTNRSGVALKNARLMYGAWAYRLGNLRADETIDIGAELSPRSTKTVITRDALGEGGDGLGVAEGRIFSAEQATAKELLNLMMFYRAAGGFGFVHLPNQYQSYCDLSRQLELGRAIFVAEAVTDGIQLVDETGQAIGENQDAKSTVIHRYVLPVKH